MGVQPHDTPVAIHKRVDPAQALVRAGQCHQRSLTTAHTAVESRPTRQKHRHAGMRRVRWVLSKGSVDRLQADGKTTRGGCLAPHPPSTAPQRHRPRCNAAPAPALPQCGPRPTLFGRQRCVFGKVLPQGLVYLVRAGVLILYAGIAGQQGFKLENLGVHAAIFANIKCETRNDHNDPPHPLSAALKRSSNCCFASQ